MASKPSLVSELQQQALGDWKKKYYTSNENLLKSLNVYYSHSVMGKAKYKGVRKCNRSKDVPNFVPYEKLSKYIRDIDIGLVEDVQTKYGHGVEDEDPADGVCRQRSRPQLDIFVPVLASCECAKIRSKKVWSSTQPVSYTHLTLPTIYSV